MIWYECDFLCGIFISAPFGDHKQMHKYKYKQMHKYKRPPRYKNWDQKRDHKWDDILCFLFVVRLQMTKDNSGYNKTDKEIQLQKGKCNKYRSQLSPDLPCCPLEDRRPTAWPAPRSPVLLILILSKMLLDKYKYNCENETNTWKYTKIWYDINMI